MLTSLDDSLWHQLPTTFDHVGTSDPRFFDRVWFAAYALDGAAAIQLTMGAYSNMNVMDAGACLIHDGKQYNVRASRALRPRFETTVGPIRIDARAPMATFGLAAGDRDFEIALEWIATAPPREEDPHFRRKAGRVVEDYTRYNQVGLANGTIRVGATTLEITDWWSCRDHSWGVRPGMGVPEPGGPKDNLADSGFAMTYLVFSTPAISVQLHMTSRHGGPRYQTGIMHEVATGAQTEVVAASLDVALYENTRRFRSARGTLQLADGRNVKLEIEALGASVAMRGIGYSGGFDDRRGLGVWRGENHVESDVWDVSAPATIRYGDGTSDEHWHRIQPMRAWLTTDAATHIGTGSLTQILSGHLPEYGLGRDDQ